MGGIEAQSGFYYQNVLGALRALDLIELGNPLFSVSFDNPAKAQYIDDIVAEGTGFVEFTQVKWAEDEDASFTLANLTAVDDSSGKSLLQKIAEGFRQIQGLEVGAWCADEARLWNRLHVSIAASARSVAQTVESAGSPNCRVRCSSAATASVIRRWMAPIGTRSGSLSSD